MTAGGYIVEKVMKRYGVKSAAGIKLLKMIPFDMHF